MALATLQQVKQVDILISKNLALQTLYFKHHVRIQNFIIIIDKKGNEIEKNLILTKINYVPYHTV